MKVLLCFAALAIACATTCSDTEPCDGKITSCHHGYILNCLGGNCVCSPVSGGFPCKDASVCIQHCNSNHHGHDHGHPGTHCIDDVCHCQPHQ